MQEPEEGKEFSPREKVSGEDEATVTEGSGRQFAMGTDDPETDRQAQRRRGSGKEFAPNVKDPDDTAPGTGKEFAPGRRRPDSDES